VAAIAGGLVAVGTGGHHRREAFRHIYFGLVGDAGDGRVLAGHQGAGVDLLALAEKVGRHLAFGLLGIQPLERHGFR
jgi:hypothetical protein